MLLTVILAMFYIVVFVIGVAWAGKKIEGLFKKA
jgi:hypothetical protein